MKKLKLDLDALRVDSFETLRARGGTRGTVRGRCEREQEFVEAQLTRPGLTIGGGISDVTCASGCGSCGTDGGGGMTDITCASGCGSCATMDCTIAC